MRIALGADHAGVSLKADVHTLLKARGDEVIDMGALSEESVDYPDYAAKVARAVAEGEADVGILACGTGIGMAIAANKIPGIRAALCHDTYSAHQCVEHDDVNVLCIGAWIIGIRVAEEVLRAFLAAEFSTEEEFRRRVRKLAELEREAARR